MTAVVRTQLPKLMTDEIAKEYHPKEVESKWYQWWESNGFFTPCTDKNKAPEKKFVVVLPPPNVTGYLHLGHALTGSVQDCLIRWHRMKGHDALYIPGSDHAGIATQVVVEKKLKSELQQSRHDLGRERFLEKVWEWKEKHGGIIQKQLRCLGLTLDWSREKFTMDAESSLAVTEAFVRLYDDGVLYRAKALVNWCCTLKSAISDLEVEYIDVTPGLFIRIPNYEKTVEVGTITAFAYKIVGGGEIVVETTRPETILGDVAVAVHPEDPRYANLKGARLQCPFRDDTIPLIFDAQLVDMNFGTGAVKVTPAHDPNDFECGKRNSLPIINVFDQSGSIVTEGTYHGMHRYDCRRSIVKALEENGLLRGQKGHAMRLGVCSRTGDIVEPLVMDQWFVNCTSMAEKAIKCVDDKELVLIPSSHEKTWHHWLGNIRPWCVSRQLWWGHRIPAYQCYLGEKLAGKNELDSWIVGRTEDEARERAIIKFSISKDDCDKLVLKRDEDVLDTWFSSSLWPLTLLGWPNCESEDMKRFFPTNLLETGHDILFFWVARMVMMSLHLVKKLPFTEVYMHAMVRDKNGEKMSKSKGNVIDPLDVLYGISLENLQSKLNDSNLDPKEISKAKELQKKTFPDGIPECGADALRFGLLTYTVSGKNVNLDIDRVVGYRQFCNKLWNVIRYALYHSLGKDYTPPNINLHEVELPLECQWILSRLDDCAEQCNTAFSENNYDFSKATSAVYNFILHEFCDVFLELTKYYMKTEHPMNEVVRYVLYYVIEKSLRLLHPMMPYVTEELWHRLPKSEEFATVSIMLAPYPEPEGFQKVQVEKDMKILLDISHEIRSIKSNYQLTNKVRPELWALTKSSDLAKLIEGDGKHIILTLSYADSLTVVETRENIPAGCGFKVVNSDITICIMLKGIIDISEEKVRLDKKLHTSTQLLANLDKKMSVKGYEEKVPLEIRMVNEAKRNALLGEIAQINDAAKTLSEM